MFYTEYPSPLGQLLLVSDGNALTGLWLDSQHCPVDNITSKADLPLFALIRDWLDCYFRGEAPSNSELPLSPAGTAFQMQVWEILRRIPHGKTVTYGDIAKEMALLRRKEKMSAQAVGQAVGKNPISILIPCHRVIGASGALTGYNGGLDKKIWLLRHEGSYKEDEQ